MLSWRELEGAIFVSFSPRELPRLTTIDSAPSCMYIFLGHGSCNGRECGFDVEEMGMLCGARTRDEQRIQALDLEHDRKNSVWEQLRGRGEHIQYADRVGSYDH